MTGWTVLAVSLVIGVAVGWWLGSTRGWPALGAVLGIFTVVGWIIVLFLPRREPTATPSSLAHHDTHRPPDLPGGTLPHHPGDVTDVP